MAGEFGIGGHTEKGPFSFARAADDLGFQAAGAFDGSGQVFGIRCIAGGAGGDDTGGDGLFIAGDLGKFPDGFGGMGDGFGLKAVRFVETLAETRLPAFFMDGMHLVPTNVRHQQFD